MLVLRGSTELKIESILISFCFFFLFLFFSFLPNENCERIHCRDAADPDGAAVGVEGQQVSLQP